MVTDPAQNQKSPSVSNQETEWQAKSSSGASVRGSEVARLLQQIEAEYEAARRGLTGLASGTARHDFINARMQEVAVYHEHLTILVGEEEATHLIYEHYVNHIG